MGRNTYRCSSFNYISTVQSFVLDGCVFPSVLSYLLSYVISVISVGINCNQSNRSYTLSLFFFLLRCFNSYSIIFSLICLQSAQNVMIHDEDSIVCSTCTGVLHFFCAGYNENSFKKLSINSKMRLSVMSIKWLDLILKLR